MYAHCCRQLLRGSKDLGAKWQSTVSFTNILVQFAFWIFLDFSVGPLGFSFVVITLFVMSFLVMPCRAKKRKRKTMVKLVGQNVNMWICTKPTKKKRGLKVHVLKYMYSIKNNFAFKSCVLLAQCRDNVADYWSTNPQTLGARWQTNSVFYLIPCSDCFLVFLGLLRWMSPLRVLLLYDELSCDGLL